MKRRDGVVRACSSVVGTPAALQHGVGLLAGVDQVHAGTSASTFYSAPDVNVMTADCL